MKFVYIKSKKKLTLFRRASFFEDGRLKSFSSGDLVMEDGEIVGMINTYKYSILDPDIEEIGIDEGYKKVLNDFVFLEEVDAKKTKVWYDDLLNSVPSMVEVFDSLKK